MNKYIYKVIELSVNGAEEDAEEYIHSSRPLGDKEKIFTNILKEVKATYFGEDYDTYEFVRQACYEFNERFEGYNLKPYAVIYDGVMMF